MESEPSAQVVRYHLLAGGRGFAFALQHDGAAVQQMGALPGSSRASFARRHARSAGAKGIHAAAKALRDGARGIVKRFDQTGFIVLGHMV